MQLEIGLLPWYSKMSPKNIRIRPIVQPRFEYFPVETTLHTRAQGEAVKCTEEEVQCAEDGDHYAWFNAPIGLSRIPF